MELSKLLKTKEIFYPHIQEKLNTNFSYKILKFLKVIEVEEDFFNKKMKSIIYEYSEKDEKDEPIQVDGGIKIIKDKQDECSKEISELHSFDVTPPDIKFTLEELSEIKLSVIDMVIISDFIIEEEEKK